jgi:biopolymer transport protein ExbB/TolQ
MDLVQRFGALTQHSAQWVMWLLVLLSLAAIAVVLERAVLFLSSQDDLAELRAELRRSLGVGDIDAARRRLEESPSFEARVAVAGLDADGTAAAEERMRGESELAKLTMERHLALLGTLGNNAPFVGEIGEALVATAIGLLVALPAVAFFNLYQRVIRARLGRAESLVREILAFRKAEAAR